MLSKKARTLLYAVLPSHFVLLFRGPMFGFSNFLSIDHPWSVTDFSQIAECIDARFYVLVLAIAHGDFDQCEPVEIN
jgi:hypothetical protein